MNHSNVYSKELARRILVSGAIGNILETYDLILISLMATTLGKVFFPPANIPYAQVVNVFYVFLIGLLVRPIGNIIMGTLVDTYGRKKLMIISLIFTGIGTLSIGLLPSYSSIGPWSTVLFVFFRIFQNFFAGIEYINSATYLIESSNQSNKGYYTSWAAVGISGGYLLASAIVLLVSTLIAKHILPEWSWRLVFSLSIFGVAFGVWVRRSIPESLVFIINNSDSEEKKKSQVLSTSLKYIYNNSYITLSIGLITFLGVCLSYIYYIYIPVNLVTSKHFTPIEAYGLNVIGLVVVVLLIPFFGIVSDFINKITLLKITCFIFLCIAFPFFWLCSYGSYVEIVLITILFSIPASCFFSLYPAIITECFPPKIRCTTASIIYQVTVSVEMGLLPLIVERLIRITASPYSPAYILFASVCIGYVGIIIFKNIITKSTTRMNSL